MKEKGKNGSNIINAILHTDWHIATLKYKIKKLECFILSNTAKNAKYENKRIRNTSPFNTKEASCK